MIKEIRNEFSFFNADNMEIMAQYPDKYFDLAIVDPPYGIGEDGLKNHSRNKLAQAKKYTPKNWDKNAPDKEYFEELVRISKYQIIWGANHFISKIPFDSSCWIVWDKNNSGDFADCELAYSNFKTAVRKFKWTWNGMLQEKMNNKQERIHPTEKPIELYEFCLRNYADKGFKILDTHLGSGSIALAIDKANKLDNMNLEFVGIELDTEYFNAAVNRFRLAHAQSCLSF
jgi:site-specific DNA-methyltransferase (adenine-specific)